MPFVRCHTTERPQSGPINGVNRRFKATARYVAGTMMVVRNGQYLPLDCWTEVDDRTVDMVDAPISGDVIQLHYIPQLF